MLYKVQAFKWLSRPMRVQSNQILFIFVRYDSIHLRYKGNEPIFEGLNSCFIVYKPCLGPVKLSHALSLYVLTLR